LYKHKEEIIFSNMPKYIWVIKARSIFKVDEKIEKKIVRWSNYAAQFSL
jgi:hypothetical protein